MAVRETREWCPEQPSTPGAFTGVDSARCCAYNQTRERFLSSDVEAADFSPAELDARLAALRPGQQNALWIKPFRGISATLIRVPIDLVYLDEESQVLALVESFPLNQVPESCAAAASVLALPANTVATAGLSIADHLVLCSPAELTDRLRRIGPPKPALRTPFTPASEFPSPPSKKADNVLPWIELESEKLNRVPISSSIPAPIAPPVNDLPELQPDSGAVAVTASPAYSARSSKGWFRRLFDPDPPDPRRAGREAQQGLVAYFFTGSRPAAHGVRDVSLTGLYVLTDQRWYLGTVVRMTLTDQRQPTPDRSITVNARVIRWGNDGVGLEFVFQDRKIGRRGLPLTSEDLSDGVSRRQFIDFLARFRSDR